ncbi:MAG TPA: TerC/Alx family metal homeostasis membrane protein, partial [Myxococcota bacterium]|nr:TerC/Alx family metal homeostasis membrane protein [Myxococcota bacterium]
GVAFTGLVYLVYEHHWGGIGIVNDVDGLTGAGEYITAYLVEKSLSVDNIFVIAMLFTFFKVPPQYQHRVLYWGILGAIVFRGIMIAAGAALVAKFDWIFYVFGAILLYTAFKMMFAGDEHIDPEKSRIVRWARKVLPIVDRYEGDRFSVVIDGKRRFTMLFLALLVIEATDVVFAVDSIPAIFGFTREPFIVMTSNIFAILGLRSLYFVVAGAMAEFRYLKMAVSIILVLVGIKMMLHSFIKKVPAGYSLGVVVLILTVGVVMSIRANRRDARTAADAQK